MTTEHDADEQEGRVTAPQQAYGMREVTIGFVILAIGVIVTLGLPLALT